MLEHGGRLRRAAEHFGIPLESWLDLSTGINPEPYPLATIPAAAWARLPEPEDGLLAAAAGYYGTSQMLPVAGSQAALQTLPRLRQPGRIGILSPTYAEHPHAWSAAGHQVLALDATEVAATLPTLDVLLVVNPNNPTGERFSAETLLAWHAQLTRRGGWLIVDEAFIDTDSLESLVDYCPRPGLVVLRSLGKFFGLAGARVGFVLAPPPLLDALAELLGPWAVAGPSREAARQALSDRPWQAQMRARLRRQSSQLSTLLDAHGLPSQGATALFAWCPTSDAERIFRGLARRGILVRLFSQPTSLRFGLPGAESQWQRLETALKELSHEGVG